MSDEAIRRAVMHRRFFAAHQRAYEEVLDADTEPVGEAGEGGSATTPADVPELG